MPTNPRELARREMVGTVAARTRLGQFTSAQNQSGSPLKPRTFWNHALGRFEQPAISTSSPRRYLSLDDLQTILLVTPPEQRVAKFASLIPELSPVNRTFAFRFLKAIGGELLAE